jgi:hypothetical protein
MNKGAGLAVVVAVAFAALRLSPSTATQPVVAPAAAHAAMDEPTPHKGAPAAYEGECAAYSAAPAAAKKDAPKREEYASALDTINRFFRFPTADTQTELHKKPTVHFAVAVVPDPRHTHLSLMFDRSMVAIQQAAQDEGYLYTASWMPWSTETQSFAHLADTQIADDLRDHRESCPGLLLFRKSSAATPAGTEATYPYDNALIVLVVGEQPTAGIQAAQWTNAFRFLCAAAANPEEIRILGPTFTGSLDSLNRLLARLALHHDKIQILSGSVSECGAVRRFNLQHANFGTFQESDSLHIYRFLKYLDSQGTPARETTILSEDETSYGALGNEASTPSPPGNDCDVNYPYDNRPLRLFYPRDMSALRAQYQKQGIFSTPEAVGAHTSHSTLADDDDDGITNSSDTIQTYSQTTNALAQEALLYGVVSQLRAHHTRYLILRCTNPLDDLFLTRFFHRAYPDARVVLLGQDMLLRREIDTTEFRGVLSIANYPLLPRDQHWTMLYSDVLKSDPDKKDAPSWQQDVTPSHAHLIFDSHLNQGTYIAARYTFDWALPIITPATGATPLQLRRKPLLSGYTDPFWLYPVRKPQNLVQHPQTWMSTLGRDVFWRLTVVRDTTDPFRLYPISKPAELAQHPPTWISVVGRDGFWPLAVLNDSTVDALKSETPAGLASPSEAPRSILVNLIDLDALRYNHRMHYLLAKDRGYWDSTLLLSLPMAWKVAVVIALLLIAYQIFGLFFATFSSEGSSVGIFGVFRRTQKWRNACLLGLNSAVVMLGLLEAVSVEFPTHGTGLIYDEHWIWWSCGLGICAVLLLSLAITVWDNDQPYRKAITSFGLSTLTMIGLYDCLWLTPERHVATGLPLSYRMSHLTSGVSPLLPALMLTCGLYLTAWQSIAGYLLLNCGEPKLPQFLAEPRLSHISKAIEFKIRQVCSPLFYKPAVLIPVFIAAGCFWLLAWNNYLPTGLEGPSLDRLIQCTGLFSLSMLVLLNARLFWTWAELRRLLRALNQLPLRRTLAHLRAVPSTSLWGMGGSVHRAQFRFFVEQLDALRRLVAIKNSTLFPADFPDLTDNLSYGNAFVVSNSNAYQEDVQWQQPIPDSGNPPRLVREVMAEAVDEVVLKILWRDWQSQRTSLNLETTAGGVEDRERQLFDMKLSPNETVVAAEEFVCFHYIAYIQNVLAGMRSIVLSMSFLFVSVCFAIASYPFIPRTQVALWMVVGLVLIGATVIYVYGGMERDETLSYITNTKPGHLGSEFYIKTASFLAGPIIGILATQFPGLADSVLGWFPMRP